MKNQCHSYTSLKAKETKLKKYFLCCLGTTARSHSERTEIHFSIKTMRYFEEAPWKTIVSVASQIK